MDNPNPNPNPNPQVQAQTFTRLKRNDANTSLGVKENQEPVIKQRVQYVFGERTVVDTYPVKDNILQSTLDTVSKITQKFTQLGDRSSSSNSSSSSKKIIDFSALPKKLKALLPPMTELQKKKMKRESFDGAVFKKVDENGFGVSQAKSKYKKSIAAKQKSLPLEVVKRKKKLSVVRERTEKKLD